MHVRSPMGDVDATVELRRNGDALSGEISAMDRTAAVEGRVEGDGVEFEGTVRVRMMRVRFQFTGRLQGDEMSGEVEVGAFGRGTWTARRSA